MRGAYVSPKKIREDQIGHFFIVAMPLSINPCVMLFDAKGDKDKFYNMTQQEFYLHWEILSIY